LIVKVMWSPSFRMYESGALLEHCEYSSGSYRPLVSSPKGSTSGILQLGVSIKNLWVLFDPESEIFTLPQLKLPSLLKEMLGSVICLWDKRL
jgi:hypothetical protein